MRLLLFIALLVAPLVGGAAAAHEVRPAYLEIDQTGPRAYAVTWKQPALGEWAIHLAPHLSNGWLDQTPSDEVVSDGFVVKHWTIHSAAPLEGATATIEGLEDTITDAFIRVRLTNGEGLDTIVRPEAPTVRLNLKDAAPTSALAFLGLGIKHILTGPDHLLFVLGLLLIVRGPWTLTKTVTAFTVAHSLTLAAATLGHIRLSTPLLNALIALSILFVAVEVVRRERGGDSLTLRFPWVVAFAFGLLHGMGFANGLSTLGLDRGALLTALALFNVGVEIGQLGFVALVLALIRAFRLMAIDWPKPAQALPAYVIGGLGAMWTVQYAATALGAS